MGRGGFKFTGKQYIEITLKNLQIPYVKEYRFSPDRMFRFDFCIPEHKVGIEYEGIFSTKSRHTTIGGYSRDVDKYNLATVNGWRVLRYTAKNFNNFYSDIVNLLKIKA